MADLRGDRRRTAHPLNEAAWADTWPRFAGRPAALDAGRYLRFEAFLADRGATPGGQSLSDLAIDVTAP